MTTVIDKLWESRRQVEKGEWVRGDVLVFILTHLHTLTYVSPHILASLSATGDASPSPWQL